MKRSRAALRRPAQNPASQPAGRRHARRDYVAAIEACQKPQIIADLAGARRYLGNVGQDARYSIGGLIVSDIDPNSKNKTSSTLGASSASTAQWHLHIPPDTYGPYSVQQLRDYARDGRLTAETLVWTEGADAWARAGDQASLKAIFAAAVVAPAPPPPPAPQAAEPRQAAPSRAASGESGIVVGGRTGGAIASAFKDATAPRQAANGDGGASANGRAMTFMELVQTCLQLKYAGFEGRARRSEYWWFMLFVTLVMGVIETIAFSLATMTSSDGSMSIVGILALVVAGILMLGLVVPSVAVAVRRLHDLGWSGWWYLTQLIPIVGGLAALAILIGFMMRGNDGPNKYGPDPLAPGNS